MIRIPGTHWLLTCIAAGLLIHPVAKPAPPTVCELPMDLGSIAVPKGDTLIPAFAIKTDTTILKLTSYKDSLGIHAAVYANHCGRSVVYGGWENWANGARSAPIVRDSVTLTVYGVSPPPGTNGDTTVDGTKFPGC